MATVVFCFVSDDLDIYISPEDLRKAADTLEKGEMFRADADDVEGSCAATISFTNRSQWNDEEENEE